MHSQGSPGHSSPSSKSSCLRAHKWPHSKAESLSPMVPENNYSKYALINLRKCVFDLTRFTSAGRE